jgi:V8-like Glu-specific endopeptidase
MSITDAFLTAKHVVHDPSSGAEPDELRVRVPQADVSSGPDIGVSILLKSQGKPQWKASDDIAVIPLPDLSAYKDLQAVGLGDFGASDDDIYQGASVIVLGYPGLLGDEREQYFKFGPIARTGIVAWINPVDRLNNSFLVDANLYPGNSGGPVFHVRTGLTRSGGMNIGGGLALIGVVSKGSTQISAVLDQSTGKPVLNPTTGQPAAVVQVAGIGGLSVIQPVAVARRLADECFAVAH